MKDLSAYSTTIFEGLDRNETRCDAKLSVIMRVHEVKLFPIKFRKARTGAKTVPRNGNTIRLLTRCQLDHPQGGDDDSTGKFESEESK